VTGLTPPAELTPPGGLTPGGLTPSGGLRARFRERIPKAWRTPLGITGAVVAALWVLVAALGPLLWPHDPLAQDLPRLQPPGGAYWFGTDELGRDVLSRVLAGARVTVPLALLLVGLSVLVGGLLGLAAGFFGRWVGETVMRLTDLVMAFPTVILAMVVAASLGASLVNAVLAALVVSWPAYARVTRGLVLGVREADYVLAAKANQPHLYEDITRAFDKALDQGEPGVDFTESQTEEVRNGRQETRTCCVITNPEGIRNASLWAGLTAIVMVISHRVVEGVASIEVRYFIGSTAGTAEEYLRWVRGHWGIENSLHWVLDVCFREDDQRHRAGNSAMNLAWLRKLALCLLKAEKNSKGKSIATRRLLAGWKDDYLLSVLAQIPIEPDA